MQPSTNTVIKRKANRKIHYCLRLVLFIALSPYSFDDYFLLEILCLWLSHPGLTSRAGPRVTALSMVPTAILMGAVGGQEELSLGGRSGFQRRLYLPGTRGSHWLQNSDSWQTILGPWPESSSGGMNNNRHWVASLRNILCPASSHTGTVSCRFVPWTCLPTSVPAWLSPLSCVRAATSSTALAHPTCFWFKPLSCLHETISGKLVSRKGSFLTYGKGDRPGTCG